MTRRKKVILGAVTCVAWLNVFGFFLAWVLKGSRFLDGDPTGGLSTCLTAFGTVAAILFLIPYYLVLLGEIRKMSTMARVIWGILLFFGTILFMPLFFFIYVRPLPPPARVEVKAPAFLRDRRPGE